MARLALRANLAGRLFRILTLKLGRNAVASCL